jgi:uncharacterized surface protein with fasciclin (FAS1) repeats
VTTQQLEVWALFLSNMTNLLTTIYNTRELSIFSNIIKVTKIDKIMDEKYEFTVFAPTDLAFGQLSKVNLNMLTDDLGILTEIAIVHIVPGRLSYHQLLQMCGSGDRQVQLCAIDSSPIWIDLSDGMKIGGATVLSTDTSPHNGVVHVIDRVLMPGEIDLIDRSPSSFR